MTSRPHVEQWSIDTRSPIAGWSRFLLRHVRPDNTVLAALIDGLIARARRDDQARRTLGLHLLGSYLRPENVLEDRALSSRDLGRSLGSISFERCVRDGAIKAAGVNLDTELVEFITGMSYAEVHARWSEVLATEDELIDIATTRFRRASRTVRENRLSFQGTMHPLETADAHRVRQLILRRYKGDKLMLRVHAFRYACDGEILVDLANRTTLQELRTALDLSLPEVRLFEFLYLRQAMSSRRVRFDGILGYRRSLTSALWLSPNTVGQLAVVCFERAPLRGPPTGLDLGLRQQLVGLMRAATYVLETVRRDKKEEIAAWRASKPAIERTSRSHINTVRAQALLPWRGHLSPSRQQIVEQLARGMTVAEVARERGNSHTAVQNALRRSEEQIRQLSDRG